VAFNNQDRDYTLNKIQLVMEKHPADYLLVVLSMTTTAFPPNPNPALAPPFPDAIMEAHRPTRGPYLGYWQYGIKDITAVEWYKVTWNTRLVFTACPFELSFNAILEALT
jgi:hypothetical protein